MSVSIMPSELGFRRPLLVEVSETLTIKNTTASPIAFKVKTTAPKQYCVRPNSGRIEPDRSVDVSVLLQAMKQDPPADYKCRDKFLVQSVPISSDKEFLSVQEIWDKVDKSNVQEKKIRVTFLPADGSAGEAEASTPQRTAQGNFATDSTPDVPPPAYASSDKEDPTGSNGFTSMVAVTPESKPTVKRALDSVSPQGATSSTPASSSGPAFTPTGGSTTAAPTEAKDAMIATLRAKLAESDALIASLRNDGGLRQRKVAGESSGTDEKAVGATGAAATPQLEHQIRQGTEGVPVQVVATLCLICFLLAYFFF